MNNFQIPLFQALGVALLISISFNFFTYKLSNNFVVSNKNKQTEIDLFGSKLIWDFCSSNLYVGTY